jgi:hypothetical protein
MLTAENILTGLARALNQWTWDPDECDNDTEKLATRVVDNALVCVTDPARTDDESAEAWRQRIADHALELLALAELYRDKLRDDDQSDTEIFACVDELLKRVHGYSEDGDV